MEASQLGLMVQPQIHPIGPPVGPGVVGAMPRPPIKRVSTKKSTNVTLPPENMTLGDAAKLFKEVATLPIKTPVSVLQEMLSRRGITPKYELMQIEGAIHEPIFRYRVLLSAELVATGTGRSKKEAKHAAAKNLLDFIIGKQSAEQANSTGSPVNTAAITNGASPTLEGSSTPQMVSPYDEKVMGNPIGWLQEMCMSRRWPPPAYDMEHEEGLPHERQFTIACRVLKFREMGTGRSKKLAKRMAAHKMWQALQKFPADRVANAAETAALTAVDDDDLGKCTSLAAQKRYEGLKDSKINVLFNNAQAHKITHFHKLLKNASGPKVSELQSAMLSSMDFNHIEFLQELAGSLQFEVTYVDIEDKSFTGKYQCLVQMSTMPVAVCYGRGLAPKDAQMSAAHNALEYLKVMTRK